MDLGDWLGSIPIITRYWFVATTVVPLLGRFGLINAAWMYLDWDLVVNRFQFWRPFTALVYFPVTPQTGFHWLMMLYFLYNYSKNLEKDIFSRRPADYLYMLLITWFVCVGVCLGAGVYFLLEPMVIAVLYVWCQVNKDQIVSFWFGMQFPAKYLPWVLCGFNVVLRGGGLNELIGIIAGHFYYFLALKYPADNNGAKLIDTPEFLYRLLPNEGGIETTGGAVPRQFPQPRRVFMGNGARLGGN